MFHEFHLL